MFAPLQLLFPKTFDFYGRRPNVPLMILPPVALCLAIYKLANDLPDTGEQNGMGIKSFVFWSFVLTIQIWGVFLASVAYYMGPPEEGHKIRIPNTGFAAAFYVKMWYSDFVERSHGIEVIVKSIGIGMALLYGFFVACSAWRVWVGDGEGNGRDGGRDGEEEDLLQEE